MSSFTENVLSSNCTPMSHNLIEPDSVISSSESMKLYDFIPEVSSGSPAFPKAIISQSQNTISRSNFSPNAEATDNSKIHADHLNGLPGIAHDTFDTSVSYKDEVFGGNTGKSFIGWRNSSNGLQTQNNINPVGHVSGSRIMGLHNEAFEYSMQTTANFCISSSAPPNNSNLTHSIEGIYPTVDPNQPWYPVPWAKQNLRLSSDMSGSGWVKPFTEATTAVDSVFPQTAFDHTWRYRTVSESSGLSPSHKCFPGSGRSGQVTTDGISSQPVPSAQFHHKRKGRALSTTSSSSDSGPTDLDRTYESRNIDLPAGHSLIACDFADPVNTVPEATRLGQTFEFLKETLNTDGQTSSGNDMGEECLEPDQLWFYEDPQGRIQGEFSSAKMLSWLLAGRYFTPSLWIRRKCDDAFSTLRDYIQLYGNVPFARGATVPPIRGGITPQLIFMFRMQNLQSANSSPLACLNQQQHRHQKFSAPFTGNGGCPAIDPSAFHGKNDLDCTSPTAPGHSLVFNQLSEALSSNSGASFIAILADYISKLQLNPSLVKELSVVFGNIGIPGSWPPTPEQQQQQISPQEVADAPFATSESIGDKLLNGSSTGDVAHDWTHSNWTSSSSCDHSRAAGGNSSSRTFRHQQTGGMSSDEASSLGDAQPPASLTLASNYASTCRPVLLCSYDDGGGDSSNSAIDGTTTACQLFQQQPTRAISRSVCSSGSASWSAESLPLTGGRRVTSTSEQTQQQATSTTRSKTATSFKNCWTEKSVTLAQPFANSVAVSPAKSGKPCSMPSPTLSSTSVIKSSPLSSSSQGSFDHHKDGPKTVKSKQPTQCNQGPDRNGVVVSNMPVSLTVPFPKKKKQKKVKSSGGSGNSTLAEELNVLVQWVRSALTGIELKESIDIPTFVELLTSIDAPYEVESMLIAYLGSSSRSEQFVREFLDRRHTCWQLHHRKRLEEIRDHSRLEEKSRNTHCHPVDSAAASKSSGSSSASSAMKASSAGLPDTQTADSAWQQIRPKNSSSRRGKKVGKQRL